MLEKGRTMKDCPFKSGVCISSRNACAKENGPICVRILVFVSRELFV